MTPTPQTSAPFPHAPPDPVLDPLFALSHAQVPSGLPVPVPHLLVNTMKEGASL